MLTHGTTIQLIRRRMRSTRNKPFAETIPPIGRSASDLPQRQPLCGGVKEQLNRARKE
jgi:hypothetical protein